MQYNITETNQYHAKFHTNMAQKFYDKENKITHKIKKKSLQFKNNRSNSKVDVRKKKY